jgi:hypothetical protein
MRQSIRPLAQSPSPWRWWRSLRPAEPTAPPGLEAAGAVGRCGTTDVQLAYNADMQVPGRHLHEIEGHRSRRQSMRAWSASQLDGDRGRRGRVLQGPDGSPTRQDAPNVKFHTAALDAAAPAASSGAPCELGARLHARRRGQLPRPDPMTFVVTLSSRLGLPRLPPPRTAEDGEPTVLKEQGGDDFAQELPGHPRRARDRSRSPTSSSGRST